MYLSCMKTILNWLNSSMFNLMQLETQPIPGQAHPSAGHKMSK